MDWSLCAVAGTAWLLQFIEDLQQSRAFHKTCELKLPKEAASIPEVLYSDFTSTAANATSQHLVASTSQPLEQRATPSAHRRAPFSQSYSSKQGC